MIITIDGPSGSGKSTIAAKLARRLRFLHVNQGAFFRSVALCSLLEDIPADDEQALVSRASRLSFSVDTEGDLRVDGRQYGERERSSEVAERASKLAVHRELRTLLLDAQRELIDQQLEGSAASGDSAGCRGVVVEGRDAGSVAFPDAELKLFLEASAEVRAERRFAELNSVAQKQGDGSGSSDKKPDDKWPSDIAARKKQVLQEIIARDERDTTRSVSPLICPQDAVRINTSELSLEEVLAECSKLVSERFASRA